MDEAGVYELYELNKDYSFKVKSVASDTKAPSIDNLNLSQNKNLVTVTFTSDENQSGIEEVEFLFEDKDGNIKEVYAYDGTSENDSYIFDVYLDNNYSDTYSYVYNANGIFFFNDNNESMQVQDENLLLLKS